MCAKEMIKSLKLDVGTEQFPSSHVISGFWNMGIPGVSCLRLLYANQQKLVTGFFIPYINFKYKTNFLPRHVVNIRAVF